MRFSNRLLATVALFAIMGVSAADAAVLDIKTVSSRPDRISGGDALVQVTQSDDTAPSVMLNGADVSKNFHKGVAPHTSEGLVSGLKLGANTLTSGGKSLTLTDYPIQGPIVSGPHETPYYCSTQAFPIYSGMDHWVPKEVMKTVYGPATDKDCSAPTKIVWLYLPKGSKVLKPVDKTSDIPADVAMTTTTSGATVKFIVRFETSTIDRGIFQDAVLYDPTAGAPNGTAPKGWNKRIIMVEGAGCPGGWYFQGMQGGSSFQPDIIDVAILSVDRLGQGYGMFGNTLQNASQSCNQVLSGEAAAMGKEHFIKSFGVPDYTVSLGSSGGSYGSSQLADNMPGLIDGIFIAHTFPDPLAISFSGLDGHLLTHYFLKTAAGKFTEAQQVAVSGYKGLQAWIDAANQAGRTDPVSDRQDIKGYKSGTFSDLVPKDVRYNPESNPKGARGDVFDINRNIYGVDPKTGFALRPYDNTGVQYGLQALNDKIITPDQFLDINENVGGYDQDDNYVPARTVGDAGAIKRAYLSGTEETASGGLANIPVFDTSAQFNDDSGYHYQWYHFAMRERMKQANGGTGNHVMWRGAPPFDKSWPQFVAWMENIQKDKSDRTARQKTIADRPKDLADGCWTADMKTFIKEPQTLGHDGTTCNKMWGSWTNPRIVAGGPVAANIIKCQMKPVSAGDYKVSFTPEQMTRMKKIFAGGVCDWSKPGIGQAGVVTWGSFGPSPVNLVYDVTRD